MSLQSLLQGYSQQVNSRLEHGEAVATENQDRKAKSLEEHFEQAQQILESAGGEVTGLAMAYHTGRKLYKKYQEKYGKKKPGTSQDGAEDKPDQPGSEGGENPAPKPEPAGTEAEGVDSGAPSGEGGLADLGFTEDDASELLGEKPTPTQASEGAPGADAGEPSAGAQPDAPAPQPDEPPSVSEQATQAAEDAQPTAGDITTTVEGQDVPGRTTSGLFGTSEEGQVTRVRPTQVVQRGQPQARPEGPKAPGEGEGPELPDLPGPATEGESGIDSVISSVRSGAGKLTGAAGDALSSIKQGAGNLAKQTAQKLGIAAGEDGAESAGFLTTEGVLDALGPIGEIGGAIMGLVGIFKSLFHSDSKPPPPKVTDQTGPVTTQVGGIDPQALTRGDVPIVGSVL